MSDVKFNCPKYSHSLEVPSVMIDQVTECPKCMTSIMIPLPA
jgi:hypothetical protein